MESTASAQCQLGAVISSQNSKHVNFPQWTQTWSDHPDENSPDVARLFQLFEDAARDMFSPALSKNRKCNICERDIMQLSRLGGMGITKSVQTAQRNFMNSRTITLALPSHVVSQNAKCEIDLNKQQGTNTALSKKRQVRQEEQLKAIMPRELQHKIEVAQEAGTSTGLSTLPVLTKRIH